MTDHIQQITEIKKRGEILLKALKELAGVQDEDMLVEGNYFILLFTIVK